MPLHPLGVLVVTVVVAGLIPSLVVPSLTLVVVGVRVIRVVGPLPQVVQEAPEGAVMLAHGMLLVKKMELLTLEVVVAVTRATTTQRTTRGLSQGMVAQGL